MVVGMKARKAAEYRISKTECRMINIQHRPTGRSLQKVQIGGKIVRVLEANLFRQYLDEIMKCTSQVSAPVFGKIL